MSPEFIAQYHPMLVHFPIALLFAYTFFELLSVVLKKDWITNSALILLAIGVLSSLAALITGNQAGEVAEKWESMDAVIPMKHLSAHENWATIVVLFFSGLLVLRVIYLIAVQIRKKYPALMYPARYVFVLLAVVGCFLIYKTGEEGGYLVYKAGVGTDLIKPAELKQSVVPVDSSVNVIHEHENKESEEE